LANRLQKPKALPESQGDSKLIPVSLEIAGSLNHYVLSFHALPLNVTKLQSKADFEKLAQGGRLLRVNTEEASEIEWRLFREINKAVISLSET
jgi:4-alpha-glucanotransferase